MSNTFSITPKIEIRTESKKQAPFDESKLLPIGLAMDASGSDVRRRELARAKIIHHYGAEQAEIWFEGMRLQDELIASIPDDSPGDIAKAVQFALAPDDETDAPAVSEYKVPASVLDHGVIASINLSRGSEQESRLVHTQESRIVTGGRAQSTDFIN